MHVRSIAREFNVVLRVAAWGLALCSVAISAGMRPQVDLSPSVVVSPVSFVPGGRNTVALTVHNAGPDIAGATTSSQSIYVLQDDFIITKQPPPFEVVEPVTGCWVERFVSEPLPDGNIALVFVYYFDSIPSGQSRTCTYDIEFDSSTHAQFESGWRVRSPNDDDTDSSNDRLDYVFQIAVAAPKSVPAASRGWLIVLAAALLFVAYAGKRRRASPLQGQG